jgi:ABC-type transporter Mla subunit MlaD
MNNTRTNLRLGVFTAVAVALFIGGLLTFGARDRFKTRYHFETAVTGDVEGLSVGAAVKFRGVRVGNVTGIALAWTDYPETTNDFVIVRFTMDAEALAESGRENIQAGIERRIKAGMRARLQGQGITGTSILVLQMLEPDEHPAPAIDWKPRDIYVPSAPSFFGSMLESISDSLENFRKLDLAALQKRVDTLLISLDDVVKQVGKVDFQGLGGEARNRLVEFKDTNESLRRLLDNANGAVTGMKLPDVAVSFTGTLEELRKTLGKLDEALVGVSSKVNEINVAPLNGTLDNARRAMAELEETLRTIKQYPSGAIFGEPPAPARSVQPPRK